MDYYLNIFIVYLAMSSASGSIPQVTDFFPEIDGDLSQVTWGHAINSRSLLEFAITNGSYMMLEADVSKGHLHNVTGPSRLIPIIAHPPDNVSDISLEMWIDRVIEVNVEGKKVGAKLDFKDLDIVLRSLEILRKKTGLLNFPLWLNADILAGPGAEDKTPIDADIFLSLCKEFFPDATLSLGWTTEYSPGADLKYSNEMFDEMVDTLDQNNVEQPVTFPIRAAFIGSSIEALETLYIDKPDSTFTVWTSANDDVSAEDLVRFQTAIGTTSVFFDVPSEILEEMDKVRERQATAPETKPTPNQAIYPRSFVVLTFLCILLSLLGAHYFR